MDENQCTDQKDPVFIKYLPHVPARNNTPVTFTKFAELPQEKLPICYMSHLSPHRRL